MTRGRIRTCWAGQRVARLRVRRTVAGVRRLLCGGRQWLAVGAVQRRRCASTPPDGVGRHEGLGLCRDGREYALLRETDAVGATAVLRGLEARAANLVSVSAIEGAGRCWKASGVYLAPSAVAAGDGGALPGSGLVLLVHVRRWLSVGIGRRRAGIHLVRRREAVGLLLL